MFKEAILLERNAAANGAAGGFAADIDLRRLAEAGSVLKSVPVIAASSVGAGVRSDNPHVCVEVAFVQVMGAYFGHLESGRAAATIGISCAYQERGIAGQLVALSPFPNLNKAVGFPTRTAGSALFMEAVAATNTVSVGMWTGNPASEGIMGFPAYAPAGDVGHTTSRIRAIDFDTVEEDCRANAAQAQEDAIKVLETNGLIGRPRVMMSDDGILTLQWRDEVGGAALIFAGDKTVSLAIKDEHQLYSDSTYDDLELDAALPAGFIQAINRIVLR